MVYTACNTKYLSVKFYRKRSRTYITFYTHSHTDTQLTHTAHYYKHIKEHEFPDFNLEEPGQVLFCVNLIPSPSVHFFSL